MSFFSRKFSKSGSSTSEKRKSSAMDDSEFKDLKDIKTEVLKVWRLSEKGSAIAVSAEQVGFFMNDERYVVLKTSNHNKKLTYDLHFWTSLQNAQKMPSDPPEKVSQVMALLKDNVVLHREIGEFESPQFKSYFKEFGVLNGNLESLFDPKNPQKYQKRLLRFMLTRNKSRIEITEVPISRHSLNANDVFIFDEGTKMTQWNGSRCDNEERLAARKYIEGSLKLRQTKCTSEFVDEEDLFENNELYRKLGNAAVSPPPRRLLRHKFVKTMLRLSDDLKKLSLTVVYQDKVYRTGINADDVTFIDTLDQLFVYVGPGANENEMNSIWPAADKYLKESQMPHKSIAVFHAGTYCEGFEEVWDDPRR